MRFPVPSILILLGHLQLLSCGNAKPTASTEEEEQTEAIAIEFTVEEAPEWTALFRRSMGWFGGDGIFAIPLDGKEQAPIDQTKNLVIFSDTMIGEIKADSSLSGTAMVNNSVAYLQGLSPDPEYIQFHWAKDSDVKPKAIFVPATPSAQPRDYYWLGDGFLNL